jgi:hypothetical protein
MSRMADFVTSGHKRLDHRGGHLAVFGKAGPWDRRADFLCLSTGRKRGVGLILSAAPAMI